MVTRSAKGQIHQQASAERHAAHRHYYPTQQVRGGTRTTSENSNGRLAYAAGLFDAKGEITEVDTGVMLHISDKHPETIRKIEAALGEGEYHRENHFTKDRSGKWQYTPIHHFAITGLLPVIDALEGMLPYRTCKKRSMGDLQETKE